MFYPPSLSVSGRAGYWMGFALGFTTWSLLRILILTRRQTAAAVTGLDIENSRKIMSSDG